MPTDRLAGNQAFVGLHYASADHVLPTASWEAEVEGHSAEGRAGGDTWTHRTATTNDWTARAEVYLPSTNPPDLFALTNTVVPFVGHLTTGGTGLFAASGLMRRVSLPVRVSDELIRQTIELHCSDGSAGPVITTSSP